MRRLEAIENDMMAAGVCAGDVKDRDRMENPGQGWPTPKCWEEDEEDV